MCASNLIIPQGIVTLRANIATGAKQQAMMIKSAGIKIKKGDLNMKKKRPGDGNREYKRLRFDNNRNDGTNHEKHNRYRKHTNERSEKECHVANKAATNKMVSKIVKIDNRSDKKQVSRDPHKITSTPDKNAMYTNHSSNEHIFVVDSGATDHMTNNIHILDNITEKHAEINVAKKGMGMTSNKQGIIHTQTCDINDVLLVPDLARNLLSVGQITKKDGAVYFSKDTVQILSQPIAVPENLVILQGAQTTNGLFILNLS